MAFYDENEVDEFKFWTYFEGKDGKPLDRMFFKKGSTSFGAKAFE